jgi:hypothetical protein
MSLSEIIYLGKRPTSKIIGSKKEKIIDVFISQLTNEHC